MNRPYDPTYGADSESGKTYVPEAVRDQFIDDKKDAIYLDESKLLNFVSESLNSSEFAVRVMTEFFGFMKNDLTKDEFTANVKEACQWFRNDMTNDLAAL